MNQPLWQPAADPLTEARRRAAARRQVRAEFAEARAYGLRARHRAKLARLASRTPPSPLTSPDAESRPGA